MQRRQLVRTMLLGAMAEELCSPLQRLVAAQGKPSAALDLFGFANSTASVADAEASLPAGKLEEIVERVIAREHENVKTIEGYAPIIETYIQEVKLDKHLGIVPKTDLYFLGQADFTGGSKFIRLLSAGRRAPCGGRMILRGFCR
jgi:hypothetical protein